MCVDILTHMVIFNYRDLITIENLFQAWNEFAKGKRKRFDVQEFERNLEDNLFELHHSLITKTYRHSSYDEFYVNDPKRRHIHKACVSDRIVHHLLYKYLYDSGYYEHDRVNHSSGEYVRGFVHNNSIENVWSHLKRGITGVYRVVSKKYLQAYVDEYAFRYNHRLLGGGMFDILLKQVAEAKMIKGGVQNAITNTS